MASPEGKNISAIRTFAADAAHLSTTQKEEGGIVLPEKEEQKQAAPAKRSLEHIAQEVSSKIDVPKESVLSDRHTHDALQTSDETGTIIRDTKRKRFRLLPAMVQATTQWFVGQKTAYEKYAHPYHAVEKADARKEVIEAAVQQSEIAPKEDFHAVAENLKEVKRKPVTTTLTLKDKAAVEKPQWSYVEDEQPQKTVQEEVTATPMEMPEESGILPQTPQEKIEPVIETRTVPEALPPEVKEPQKETPQLVAAQEKIESTVAAPQEETPLPPPPQSPQPAAKAHVMQPAPYTPPPAAKTEKRQSVMMPNMRIVTISVVAVAIVSGIGASVYFFGGAQQETSQEKTISYSVPSLINAASTETFTLPSDRTSFLFTLQSGLLQNSNRVVQLHPMELLQEGTQRPASSEQILEILNLRITGSFARSIMEITFGGAAQDPYIIIKTTSFDAAFAGMLDWERTMSADLSPLFGEPVVATFDPSARTDTQIREAFYKDIIASNKNARLLLDEEGKDRIIYTFIDQNTILITTTQEALDVLVPLMK